jgi:hypothetical protein
MIRKSVRSQGYRRHLREFLFTAGRKNIKIYDPSIDLKNFTMEQTTKLILLDSLLQEAGDGRYPCPPPCEVRQAAIFPDKHLMHRMLENNKMAADQEQKQH